MSVNKPGYYEYRSRHARQMAAAATDPKVAAIHLELAEQYDALARQGRPRPTLRVVSAAEEQRPCAGGPHATRAN